MNVSSLNDASSIERSSTSNSVERRLGNRTRLEALGEWRILNKDDTCNKRTTVKIQDDLLWNSGIKVQDDQKRRLGLNACSDTVSSNELWLHCLITTLIIYHISRYLTQYSLLTPFLSLTSFPCCWRWHVVLSNQPINHSFNHSLMGTSYH